MLSYFCKSSGKLIGFGRALMPHVEVVGHGQGESPWHVLAIIFTQEQLPPWILSLGLDGRGLNSHLPIGGICALIF